MKINSARQAWHDCKYNPTPGQASDVVQLGVVVQTTDRGPTANHEVHGTLAGHIQSAIARLHPQIRVFRDFMHAADQDDDVRETAEKVVFLMVVGKSPRMTAAKREKLELVVKGVMRRYQYMHQQQSQAQDVPLLKSYAPFRDLDKPTQRDLDALVDQLRKSGLSIDGDNAYKRDLFDSIVGALAFGAQNRKPPPPGHWGQKFWEIGREERALTEEMPAALQAARDLWGDYIPPGNSNAMKAMRLVDAAIAKATK